MYRVPGALVLGSNSFSVQKYTISLSGGIEVAVPITRDSEIRSVFALAYTKDKKLRNVLELAGSWEIPCSDAFSFAGVLEVKSSITDALSGKLEAFRTISSNGILHSSFEVSGGKKGAVGVNFTIGDFANAGSLKLCGAISQNYQSGFEIFKTAIDADEQLVECSLKFFVNGKDLSHRLLNADLCFYSENSTYAYFSAVIKGDIKNYSKVAFVIEGNTYYFCIDKVHYDRRTSVIKGKAVKEADNSFQEEKHFFVQNVQASTLIDAEWRALDYEIPLIYGDFSEKELLVKLADEVGGGVRNCADNSLKVVDPFLAEKELRLGTVFSFFEKEENALKSGVKVLVKNGTDPVLKLKELKNNAGDFAEVFIFADSSIEIKSDAQLLRLKDKKLISVEEEIFFSKGSAKASYPVFRGKEGVVAFEGRNVFRSSKQDEFQKISYETICYEYEIYEPEPAKRILTAEATKTLYKSGGVANFYEYEQKFTREPAPALRRAENAVKFLDKNSFFEITHLFNSEIASGEPVFVATDMGGGYALSSGIVITTSPLKIIQTTKLFGKEKTNG